MTWDETHRRYAALREVSAIADAFPDADLPWSAEYAAVFGTPDALAAALRYSAELNLATQLDSHLSEHELEARRRYLTARYSGVLRMLDRYAARGTVSIREEPQLASA